MYNSQFQLEYILLACYYLDLSTLNLLIAQLLLEFLPLNYFVLNEDFLKKLLENGLDDIISDNQLDKAVDLKIVDYLSVKELNEYSNYQNVLTVAMQREKIAYEFAKHFYDAFFSS